MGRGDGVSTDWPVRLPTRSSGILFATLAVPLVSFLLSYSLAPEFINNAKAHLRRVHPPKSSVPHWSAEVKDWDFFSRSVLRLTGLSDSYYLFQLEGYHPRYVSVSVSSQPPESGRWARKPYSFGRAHRTLDLATEPPVDEIPGFLSPVKKCQLGGEKSSGADRSRSKRCQLQLATKAQEVNHFTTSGQPFWRWGACRLMPKHCNDGEQNKSRRTT